VTLFSRPTSSSSAVLHVSPDSRCPGSFSFTTPFLSGATRAKAPLASSFPPVWVFSFAPHFLPMRDPNVLRRPRPSWPRPHLKRVCKTVCLPSPPRSYGLYHVFCLSFQAFSEFWELPEGPSPFYLSFLVSLVCRSSSTRVTNDHVPLFFLSAFQNFPFSAGHGCFSDFYPEQPCKSIPHRFLSMKPLLADGRIFQRMISCDISPPGSIPPH